MIEVPASHRIPLLVGLGALAVFQTLVGAWALGAAVRLPGFASGPRCCIGALGLVFLATAIALCVLVVRIERIDPEDSAA